MFFLYLAIFITIVATPFFVTSGWWIFSEDETESIVLLGSGIISFVIYRLKDYQVFETIKDRIRLQRSIARAQKELSESYSYIGQANRRTDIIYEIFSDLSHMDSESYDDAVMRAMKLLPYTDVFSFRSINIAKNHACNKINRGMEFTHLPDELFCKKNNSHSYRHRDILFIYSELGQKGLRTCIALPYSEQAENDIDFFKALTAYFTMVYVFHDYSCTKKSTNV